jgi:hypothetical protein
MNMVVWGIIAIVYAALVVVIAVTKPGIAWDNIKIRWFRKHLGERGTEIFFYIWAFAFLVLGVWLLTR